MQKLNHRIMAIMISIILIFSLASIMLSTTTAHDPPFKISTYAYLSIEPDPVGVGQEAYVNFWIDKPPPTAASQYGDRWHNFEVTVTKPDGTTEKLGPFTSDDTGGAHTVYTPSVTGNYSFVFNFPGQTLAGENPIPGGSANDDFIGDYYQPSTSQVVTLYVQDEPIMNAPSNPLPTNYWTRPIYSENLDWYKIGGNWLGTVMQSHGGAYYNISGNFNPYTEGPNSAHVLWTKPLAAGGIIGGEFGGTEYGSSYYQTPQYEPKFQGIVINGILYFKSVPGSSTYPAGWVALDIRTGETVWTKETTNSLLCGQVLDYISPNQFGGLSYLWSIEPTVKPNKGTTYGLYDAMTGNWILDIVNATGFSKIVMDEGGNLLGYYTNNTDNTLCMWNSTKCIQGLDETRYWYWRPVKGAMVPFDQGIQMQAPLLTTYQNQPINPKFSILTMSSDIVLLHSTPVARFGLGWDLWVGYDAHTGKLLWGPTNHTYVPFARIMDSPAMDGKIFEFTHPTMTWDAYSLSTGEHLWGPTQPYDNPWGYFVAYDPIVAYGMLYQSDFSGTLHAYNVDTGKEVWTFSTGTSGYETPYGTYPLYHIEAVADGKVYVEGGHTYSPPIFKGSQLWAINATTGEKIWSVSSFTTVNQASAVLADGVLVEPNAYDNQLYAYGKGPSSTTVSVQPFGQKMVISGTVTDISSGTNQQAPAANFPHGVPAVSDESQSAWMEYVYMQQPKPTNATGVSVSIDVLDSNGNTRTIGSTNSDASGAFSFTWTPDIVGDYTVTANFLGSASYYPSSAEAFFTVSEPEPTVVPALTKPSMADLYFIPAIIGLFVFVAIIGAVIILVLFKKRP
jgi:outer membrane protein assembly factor BamB